MAMLLEDLADETAATNRRVADRLDAEMRDPAAALVDLRSATGYALVQAAQQDEFMRQGLAALAKDRLGPASIDLLRALLQSFQSCERLVDTARAAWAAAQVSGIDAERLDELDRAKVGLAKLIREVAGGIRHREEGWQPKDPERFAEGMRLAREGKAISPDEARTRIRRAAH